MKMLIDDVVRIRKMADGNNGQCYVTLVEASAEYQSPVKLEFPNHPALNVGDVVRLEATTEYTFYPASSYDGKNKPSSHSWKVMDVKPFTRLTLEYRPEKNSPVAVK